MDLGMRRIPFSESDFEEMANWAHFNGEAEYRRVLKAFRAHARLMMRKERVDPEWSLYVVYFNCAKNVWVAWYDMKDQNCSEQAFADLRQWNQPFYDARNHIRPATIHDTCATYKLMGE